MLLSIVIPVYNEEQALPALVGALAAALADLDLTYEIVFINDGSRDGTSQVLERAAVCDCHIRVVEFSRNFGQQAAITAGLDLAAGDAVLIMDADLQDPPELIAQLVARYREGYDVVSPQRAHRPGETWLKRATAAGFYWLMQRGIDRRVMPQVSDFRLYSRRAVVALRGLREQHRFLRGMVAWLGLKEIVVPFDRARRVAGETKYPLSKMMRFAWTAISSSSAAPLRLTALAGLMLAGLGAVWLMWLLTITVVARAPFPEWSSLVAIQMLFNGAVLLAVGLIGDYLARVYEESKGRPLYVVARSHNVTPPDAVERAIWLVPRDADEDSAGDLVEADRAAP
jgi:dolichol-phosphate mannosyltransferase